MTQPTPLNHSVLTRRSLVGWFLILLLIVVLFGLACSFVGIVSLPFDWSRSFWDWPIWRSQLWHNRLSRLSAAGLVGAALASAGLALQGLLRNPLADPYVLGISSGAGVGVLIGNAIATAVMLPAFFVTPLAALVGAVLTAGTVYAVAQRRGRLDPFVLLLSGVIVNVFNGALILTVLQFVTREKMIDFIGWGMGQIPEYLWFRKGMLLVCSIPVFLALVQLLVRAASLNTLGLGDEVASSSGVPIHRLRVEIFLIVSLVTAVAVSLAGPVGFVGLIVPHVFRLILGPDHRRLFIATAFGGAVFLMGADTLCRIVGEAFHLGELPVGVVTAMIGGPFFIWLLRRGFREERS